MSKVKISFINALSINGKNYTSIDADSVISSLYGSGLIEFKVEGVIVHVAIVNILSIVER